MPDNIDSSRIGLLETLKNFTENAVKNLILPVNIQRSDDISEPRAAQVWLMQLPEFKSADKKVPYIIHQLVSARDAQKIGERMQATALVRSVFAVYHEDAQEGSLALLNLMERFRIALLESVAIGRRYELDLEKGPEYLIYPDNQAPYFVGEMITNWKIPSVERKVNLT